MTAIKQNISSWFDWYKQIPASSLSFYRICFGMLMLFSTIRFMHYGWVDDFYIDPSFHFSYYGFEWLPYPSPTMIYAMFYGLIISSILIILGLFYRFAAISFFVLFTYIELLDKTNYLNHYYFVSLIALLMIFLPANRYFALDTKIGLSKWSDKIYNWQVGILKFQMAVVYIFAGIAKLGSDWLLNAQPLKTWLHTVHHWPVVGSLMKEDWVAYLFSWSGCIFDLFIIFFLINKKTRNYAYFFVVSFHLLTWMIFPIGVFPWVMIVGTTIFLSVRLHENVLNGIHRFLQFIGLAKNEGGLKPNAKRASTNYRLMTNTLVGSFILFQLSFPLRHTLYDGDLFWKEQGFRFGWRVMLIEKAGHGYFYLHDPKTGKEWEVPTENHLTKLQEKQMSFQPDMILQYAHHIEEVYSDTVISTGHVDMHFKNPEIRAEVYVTLNGRPSQLFVDKKHNLATLENDLSERHWVEPFSK